MPSHGPQPAWVGREGIDYRSSICQSSSVKSRSRALPAACVHVLLALLAGENHGYALMRRVDELSEGRVKMGPGTLYGTLNRLVADGLIEETTDQQPRDEGERRRYYRLTGSGQAAALGELDRLRSLLTNVTLQLPGATT